MTEPLLQRIREANVAVIYDQMDNSRWGMLRGLPAIHYLRVDDFTYPKSWRQLAGWKQYDYLEYTYHVLDTIDFENPPPLGIITNRHYEWETPYSIQNVVSRYTVVDSPLVVLSDSRGFTPEGGQRPLGQEQFADRIGSYEQVYSGFKRRYDEAGFTLSLRDTRNLFIQDNAILYQLVDGRSLRTTRDLFEILPDAPYLPLYDAFTAIFGREEEFGAVPLETEDDVDGLARWLRRRIEWDRGTARDVAELLNRKVADAGQTFDPSYAERSPVLADAREIGKGLDTDESSIHARYRTWLTSYEP